MKKIVIVTGASGHLGSAIIQLLRNTKVEIRGLVLPNENIDKIEGVTYYEGNVCDKDSLIPIFSNLKNKEVKVIHTVGLIDIEEGNYQKMFDVNVLGTENIIALCQEFHVKRLLYVSSVHAISESGDLKVIKEVNHFSPDEVEGDYAKTKAIASQLVMDAGQEGLDVILTHPSGIIGPHGNSKDYLIQLISNYINRTLPASVKGGYDFVDIRDVAKGCVLALEKGIKGSCYILSNRHYEIDELLEMIRTILGGHKLISLPIWVAKGSIPFIQLYSKAKNVRPLFTSYSLYTLESNDRFSHDKATSELGYIPRDMFETIQDTVEWILSTEE